MARAQAVVDSLWQSPPNPPHLVHGDLTPRNVIVSPRTGLVPIDFQDTGHDSVRAAMIYQHATAEADQVIADALDKQIGAAKKPAEQRSLAVRSDLGLCR